MEDKFIEEILNGDEFDRELKELVDMNDVVEIPSDKEWIYDAILEVLDKVKPPSKWNEMIKWFIVFTLAGMGLGLILPI